METTTKRFKKIEQRKKEQEQIRQSRSDSQLHNVIISEKKIKALDNFKFTQVPLKWKSKDALEKSLTIPMGKDFNSLKTHDKLIQPKVKTITGRAIKPIHHKIV